MKKKDLFVRMSMESEYASELKALFRAEKERYVMNLYQLQSKADLTFKEARAFLLRWYGTPASMAINLSVDIHAIYNLQRKAKKKVEDTGLALDEIFGDYPPINFASDNYAPIEVTRLVS